MKRLILLVLLLAPFAIQADDSPKDIGSCKSSYAKDPGAFIDCATSFPRSVQLRFLWGYFWTHEGSIEDTFEVLGKHAKDLDSFEQRLRRLERAGHYHD